MNKFMRSAGQVSYVLKFLIVISFIKCSVPVYTKERFPNPLIDPVDCGWNQDERSFLCDPDRILTKKQRESINDVIKLIENSTSCICQKCLANQHGYRVGVAIVKNIPIKSGTGISTSMVTYGDYLRKSWRLGKCDDDILVLLSINDKKIYVSRGAYIAKILKGDVLRDIYEDQGDKLYSYDGLKNVLNAIRNSFNDSQDPTIQNLPYIIGGAVGGFVLLVLIIYCIVSSCRKKKKRPNNDRTINKKHRSDEMNKKIAAFEKDSVKYPDCEYSKAKIDEPDVSMV